MKQQSFSCWMKYFLCHAYGQNPSVLNNPGENWIFSPLRQINWYPTKEKPINQKCVETFFSLFNNLHAIERNWLIRIVNWSVAEFLNSQRDLVFQWFCPYFAEVKNVIFTKIFQYARICPFFVLMVWNIVHSTAKTLLFHSI